MLAGVAFAEILETGRTAFTVLAHWKAFSASRFRLSSEAGNKCRHGFAQRFALHGFQKNGEKRKQTKRNRSI